MADFVQYHNPDRTGPLNQRSASLYVLTNKPVSRLPGNRVWLISGHGRPRQYALCCVFRVDRVGDSDRRDFRYYLGGEAGHAFRPPLPLDHLGWFGAFLRRQANFSLGLRELSPDDAGRLAELALAAGIVLP
jgi:hypothetical protein